MCILHWQLAQERRTKASFAKFFATIGKQVCEKVEFVCSDMWKPYFEMIALHCPNVLNILDRFHIALLDEHIRKVEVRVAALQELRRHLVAPRELCPGERPTTSCGVLQGLSDPIYHASTSAGTTPD